MTAAEGQSGFLSMRCSFVFLHRWLVDDISIVLHKLVFIFIVDCICILLHLSTLLLCFALACWLAILEVLRKDLHFSAG